DVRIVAATNKDLERAVAEGSFRRDLYYRLDVIPIHLPPLRMRVGDIPLLVNHFLERFAKESGKPAPTLSQEAMRVLLEQEWRGNVREL
ncbi:MAG: sigma 54-interacting transcriptional regulator, partial [Nitrospira sp.]